MPIVNTLSGPIKGIKKKTCFGDEYYSFQKIPYAKAPIGNLRFKDPILHEPWKETLDCTNEGPVAFSWNNYVYSVVGNENCLHLNIFSRNIQPKALLPVMIYIHGGAFVRGSSSTLIYGPDYLLQKNIVFASFNYRLGAFGFLSLQDPNLKVPGNAGLKDQNLALKWIKENISHFGGDPNNITLFGESAGAASVHYHMISNQSNKLFNRAILMSGCVYNNWALVPSKNWAMRLAEKLGWNSNERNENKLLEYLQKVEPEKIILAQEKLLTEEEKLDQLMAAFGPSVEPYASENSFITEHPVEMAKKAWGNNISILIGGCSNEGLLWYKEINKTALEKQATLEHFIPLELREKNDNIQKLAKLLKDFYFNSNNPTMENMNSYISLLGDVNFWHGFHRTLLARLKYSSGTATYLYRFDIVSPLLNHHKMMFADETADGACHADDKSYLFKTAMGRVPESGTKEYQAMQRFVSLFTKFAMIGDPNSDDTGIKDWTKIQNLDRWQCLNLNIDGFQMIELPENDRLKTWDTLYEGFENLLV